METYPLRKGYKRKASPETTNAVRKVITDWDGTNWLAVLTRLASYKGKISKPLPNWTEDDIRQCFAINQRDMGFTVETTTATITPIAIAEVKIGRVNLPKRKRRKADELTNAQEALAAAIESWHQYEATTLSCGNSEPASYSKLLDQSGVASKDTAKKFFDAWLSGGNAEYQRLCKSSDAKALAIAIAKLSKTGALAMARYSAELLADATANRPDED